MHNGPENTEHPPQEQEEASPTLDAFYTSIEGEALNYAVSRLEPAVISTDDGDMPVRGMLHTSANPITEEDVQAKHGGGKYKITVFTQRSAWDNVFEFEIEGEPIPTHEQYFEFLSKKAKEHSDGQPHAFPQGGASRVNQQGSSGPDTVALKELINTIIQVLPPLLQQRMEDLEKGEHQPSPFDGAPAEIRMPRDVALKLMQQLYAPEEPKSNSQLRLGIGLGAALSAMGTEVLLEDLATTVRAVFGRARSPHTPFDLPIPKSYGLDEFEKNMPPGWMKPVEGGPVVGVSDPDGYRKWGIPGPLTDQEDSDDDSAPDPLAGIAGFEHIGHELKKEAMRRWKEIEKKDPERFDDMKRRGLNPEYVFEHFEEIFGEFFQTPPEKKPPGQK